MNKILNAMLDHSAAKMLRRNLESDSRIMALFAILCVLCICWMSSSVSPDLYSSIFRVVWVILSSSALVILYRSGVYAEEMSSSRSLLTILAVLSHLAIIKALFALQAVLPNQEHEGFILLFFPWIFAPCIISVLVGRRMGMFTSICVALLGGVLLPDGSSLGIIAAYIGISLLAGSTAAAICGRVHKREHILYAGFIVGLVVVACVLSIGSLRNSNSLLQGDIQFKWLVLEACIIIAASFAYAVFISGAMPLLERIFNLCTPITWLELGDMNHKLLKELQFRAPGTFHHSLLVSRLSEAAAESIGANPTHAAVCALFHDIGKLKNPEYFAENISEDMPNPHDALTPDMSARIITRHSCDGVALAEEHHLNSRIIDAIREHHGISTAYFFYRKAMDNYEAEFKSFEEGHNDNRPDPIDKADFSYKGPIPQSKESGIISMADAVESATRSLKNPSIDDINNMIDSIFKGRILDGHLVESGLTLGDLAKMRTSFFSSIKSMHHNRIAYPKAKEEDDMQPPLRLD